MEISSILFEANKLTANNYIFSLDCLQKLCESDSRLNMEGKRLIFRGDINDFNPVYVKIIKEALLISAQGKSVEINEITNTTFTFWAPASLETWLAKRLSEMIVGSSDIFPKQKSSGYKWILNDSNDFLFDIEDSEPVGEKGSELIKYVFFYRYGTEKKMQKMFDGVIIFLDLERYQEYISIHSRRNEKIV